MDYELFPQIFIIFKNIFNNKDFFCQKLSELNIKLAILYVKFLTHNTKLLFYFSQTPLSFFLKLGVILQNQNYRK